jgi:hypothetical protein
LALSSRSAGELALRVASLFGGGCESIVPEDRKENDSIEPVVVPAEIEQTGAVH